jgi:AraC-like DNA-binding protein
MNALTVVAMVGTVQGVLLLILIAFRFRHRKNTPLGLLLLVFSIRLVTIPTWNPVSVLNFPGLLPLTTPLPFLFGPLLWWYTREIGPQIVSRPRFLPLHFLAYIAEVAAISFTVISMNPEEYRLFVDAVFTGHPPLWMPLRNAMKVILNTVYLVLAGRIVFGSASANLSPGRRVWLRSLVVVPSIVLVAFSYVAVFPLTSSRLTEGSALPFLILSVAMAGLIYAVSLMMLIAPDISALQKDRENREVDPLCTDSECEHLVRLVENRLGDGAFHDPELSLADLATQIQVHPNRLSFAINHTRHVHFRTLLNTRRLDYLTDRIRQGALTDQTLLDLAFEAGFPSKSTFNRVFKETLSMVPTDYAKQFSSDSGNG